MNQKEVEREKAEVARTKHRESIKYIRVVLVKSF